MAIITGTGGAGGGGTNPNDPTLQPEEHGGSGLFVYDVQAVNAGKNILTMREASLRGEFTGVTRVSTDDSHVRVFVCWDRNEKAAVGLPLINGTLVDGVDDGSQNAAINSPTFTSSMVVPVTANLTVTYDDATITIPMSVAQTPVVSNFLVDQTFPVGQSEIKQGDPIFISFEVDIPIKAIEVLVGGAGAPIVIPVNTNDLVFSNVQITAAAIGDFGDVGTDLPVTIRVQSKENAYSANYTSDNTIHCNDQRPIITWGAVTYPGGRKALKGAEEALVPVTIQHFSTTLLNPSVDLNPNTITPTGDFSVGRVGGDYVYKTNNLTLTATRAENGSQTVSGQYVNIANVAPTLSVTENPVKLRASELNTVSVNSSQVLVAAPSLSGTISSLLNPQLNGIGHSEDATTFSAGVTIPSNESGLGAGVWDTISGTGLSGLMTTTVTGDNTYLIQGYAMQEVIKPAFQNWVEIPYFTTEIPNVRVHWLAEDGTQIANTPAGGLLIQSQGSNVGDIVVNGYRVDVNPLTRSTKITILDKSKVEAISKNSIVRIEEL